MNLESQLNRDEGRRSRIYQDSLGKWTIGIGRNLSDRPIGDDEIDLMLRNDIEMVRGQLSRMPLYLRLDPVRQGALENMCFNMGIVKLLGFSKFLDALDRSNWTQAGAEMLNSLWAQQVGPRAQRLVTQIRTGEWT